MICLIPHCAYLSETSRMLEMHRALQLRGARVRIATHGGTHEGLLRASGVPYDVIEPRMDDERCARFVRSAVGLGPTGQSMYADDELREHALAEADYFREHGVTVAVTGFTLSALLSTRLAGVKLVTEHAGSFVPPAFERGLVPAPSRRPTWARGLPEALVRWGVNRGLSRMSGYCAGFNRVAAELGVEGVPSLPALLLGDLTLVPEIPEVLGISAEDLAAWRPGAGYRAGTRMRYTGPLFAHLDLPIPAHVADFLDRPGPVVYVAITSSPPALIRRVVRALAALDVRVLVAGTVHDLGDMAGERVMVEGVLPSHLIMPRVDLAVTSGGQGSVQTAMAAGTPLLGIPLQLEQDFNMDLLTRLGAARACAPRRVEEVGALAREMLADDGYRVAAQWIKSRYDAVDGPGEAAEAIMSMAAVTVR